MKRIIYGMSKQTPRIETVELKLANVGDILQKESERLATIEAEKKDKKVFTFISDHGFKKLFFKRWMFIWCDMKELSL